jgi:4-hydroxy-3-polyprenylbenzoate decarboxylase
MNSNRYILGLTGASGAPFALTILDELLRLGHEVHLIVTEAGWRVLKEEHQWEVHRREKLFIERYGSLAGKLVYHPNQDIGASIASGSFLCEGMIVAPCTMGTLAKIAHGLSIHLLERAADVMLKERRKLILVPRETPLSSIQIQNMLTLSQNGAIIAPAMPVFYHQPETMEDMIRFMSGKVLDLLQIEHHLYRRWGGAD